MALSLVTLISFIFQNYFHQCWFYKEPKFFHCEICQLSKHIRSSYQGVPYKFSCPFSLTHSDMWGPLNVKNITGSWWFVLFIDDHSRLTWLFLMKENSEARRIFQNFKNMVKKTNSIAQSKFFATTMQNTFLLTWENIFLNKESSIKVHLLKPYNKMECQEEKTDTSWK